MGYGRFETPALENYLDIIQAKIKKVEAELLKRAGKKDTQWIDSAWCDLNEVSFYNLGCTEHKGHIIWCHSWWQSKKDRRLYARVRGMGEINKEKGDDTYFVSWAPQGEMFLCSTPIDRFIEEYELYNGTGEYPKGVDFVSSQKIFYPEQVKKDPTKIYI